MRYHFLAIGIVPVVLLQNSLAFAEGGNLQEVFLPEVGMTFSYSKDIWPEAEYSRGRYSLVLEDKEAGAYLFVDYTPKDYQPQDYQPSFGAFIGPALLEYDLLELCNSDFFFKQVIGSCQVVTGNNIKLLEAYVGEHYELKIFPYNSVFKTVIIETRKSEYPGVIFRVYPKDLKKEILFSESIEDKMDDLHAIEGNANESIYIKEFDRIISSIEFTENPPAIQYLLDNGIASGYPDPSAGSGQAALFKPENPINRAEFTKIIVGATRERQAIDACLALSSVFPFPDVPVGEWFAPYVCTARQFGIVAGHPDGTFRPADSINTAEAAKIVVEAFDLYMPVEDGGNWPASRSPTGEGWYQPYMQALRGVGALPSSAQEPEHLLTRGEMAEIIYGVMTH